MTFHDSVECQCVMQFFATYVYAPRGELHADCGLGLEVELIPGEPGEQVALSHAGVPDQHHWKSRRQNG